MCEGSKEKLNLIVITSVATCGHQNLDLSNVNPIQLDFLFSTVKLRAS